MRRPSAIALRIVAKLSSASTTSAASFVASVPLMPIAMPTFGARQGGRVVDAVPGHRDDLAVRLQRPDDPDLVLGARARVHVDVAHDLLAAAPG